MLRLSHGLSILKISTNNQTFTRLLVTEVRKAPVFPAFVKLHFTDVKSKYPELKSTEIMKKLSEMYKATPTSELQKLSSNITLPAPKSEKEKMEDRRKLTLARKNGFPRPIAVTGYQVFIHEQLTGNKGKNLEDMKSKLANASKAWNSLNERSKEPYVIQAVENKLVHLRELRTWCENHGIAYSGRKSVLINRFFAKHEKNKAAAATAQEILKKSLKKQPR
nr:transcription factor a mitochondrial [Hymenolepis microstoma]